MNTIGQRRNCLLYTSRVIHSVSGLKRGVGDICRLVGIPLNEINAKLAAGILPDNGTWRLPTANELAALLLSLIHI